jgi:hypothetical protein
MRVNVVIRARTSIVCVLVLLATSAPARAAGELTRREKGDLAIKARAILKKHCFECHGGSESRGTIQVLDHSRLVAAGPNPVPFVAPDKAAGSQIIQFLEEGSMPPGDRPRPSNEEIQTLKEWIACTAPSYPAAFDDRTTLNAILNDLQQHADQAPNLRYFSLAHLIKDDADLPNLKKVEFDLQKALTWCGVKPPAGKLPAEPVDGTATLFRFDVRHAGWDNHELFFRSPKGGNADIYRLTPYDLILLEYPHAVTLPPADALAERLNSYVQAARLARPAPFLRADWLAEKVARLTPLADDLKSLGELSAALQKQNPRELGKERNMPCGPATRAFAAKNPVPAAPKAESARPVLPLTAWYSGDCQANAPAFALTVEAIDVGGKTVKEIAPGAPFRLKVTTDRKVNFVLLNVFANRDVEILRTKQGGFLEAGQHFLVPPAEGGKAAGGFKIPGILTGEKQANEYFVLLASTEKITPPTIVRSRHAAGNPDCMDEKRYPIYRFIFDTDAKFDQSMVVRKVIAITVTEKQ